MIVITEGGAAQKRSQRQHQAHAEKAGDERNPAQGDDGAGNPGFIIGSGGLGNLAHPAGC